MRRTPRDPTMELAAPMGDAHERAYLAELRAEGRDVWTPDDGTTPLDAMRARRQILYQPTLRAGDFEGKADFLLRTSDATYEVLDTKLALEPKPYFLVQL